jgi:ATP-dependent DNA helicase RecQ
MVESFGRIEDFLLPLLEEKEKTFHIKELNEHAETSGCAEVTPNKIKTIINFWAIRNWIKRQHSEYSRNHVVMLCIQPKELLKEKLEKRHELAKFIVRFLYEKSNMDTSQDELYKEDVLVEFSVQELKEEFEKRLKLFETKISMEDIEDTLFYLSRIDAIKIEGGFLVLYNRLTIERVEQDNKKRYKVDDYQKLNQFYENKVQQIHIVGEYARKMISDYKDALQFVEDYFHLNYPSFLNKYFKGSRQNEIKRNLTPAKFKQLFGELSPTQLKIINDNESKYIVVAAGPGSGKTRVLVHKLASLLLMEDVKHEQLLMVTFSRAAATEFKKRLLKLIGNAAHYIEIKTFHSYCFDLLGKVGSIEKSDEILKKAIEKIRNEEVEQSRITKTVLVIDEAQDMNQDEFELINVLMERNEDMRVIAVGDDDQSIYEFRKASPKYLLQLIQEKKAAKYELIENYRSKANLIAFTNQFVNGITSRLKKIPIVAKQPDNGSIKVVHYQSNNLITPVVHDIITTSLTGTTCVIVKTNEEALQITGLLLKEGMQAKLIQTHVDFNLYDLWEIRFFLSRLESADDVFVIGDDLWDNAKRELQNKFRNSTKLEVCNNLIKDFEATNQKKKYKSDLEVFIRESSMEDFFSGNGETIFISTIHKTKGKEFDNVFLMLDNFNAATDEAKRQLYVAMTRAKQNLTIHLNGNYLEDITAENLERIEDKGIYLAPNEIVMHLTHKDVWLNYFISRQYLISSMITGDTLTVNGDELLNSNGKSFLKFSNQFKDQIKTMKKKNYELKAAKVNFIVYWKNGDMKQEVKIVLPELSLQIDRSYGADDSIRIHSSG